MRSVRLKLSAAFIAVAVLQTVLAATFSSYVARQTFRQYVEHRPRASPEQAGGGQTSSPGQASAPGPTAAPGPAAAPGQAPAAPGSGQGASGGSETRRVFGPREILFSSRFRTAIWGAALTAALVGVLFALWLTSVIVKPVVALTEATRAVAQGRPLRPVSVSGQDELAELAQAFNLMAARLAEEDKQRRRLFAGIAHELRTPLSVIQGTLEGILDHVIEPTPERVAALHSQAMLLKRLITDLRDLSLAQAGHLRLNRRPVDLSAVVRETLEGLAPLAGDRAVALRQDLPAGLGLLQIDPDRMRQVVQNLVENAVRHTPPGGEVRVRLRDANGKGVQLSVADTGTGIGAADLPHIFEHFYRADESRARSSGGTGMGLAIVKSLVEAHGGRVTVDTAAGSGSTFTVTLPRAP